MKKIFLILVIFALSLSKAQQILPLTTMSNELPLNSYIKDLDNQLPAFEGIWKGISNNKTFTIVFKKVKYYDTHLKNNPFYQDLLFGKFQVKDASGKILFDNLSVDDNNVKVKGINIFPSGKYRLMYLDSDLCNKAGLIMIGFTNDTKKEMKLRFTESDDQVNANCFYYGKPVDQRPEPFPKEIILTKQ